MRYVCITGALLVTAATPAPASEALADVPFVGVREASDLHAVWYARNIRIFANVQRLAAPGVRLVEARDYL